MTSKSETIKHVRTTTSLLISIIKPIVSRIFYQQFQELLNFPNLYPSIIKFSFYSFHRIIVFIDYKSFLQYNEVSIMYFRPESLNSVIKKCRKDWTKFVVPKNSK